MGVNESAVLCGACKCQVETVANPKPQDKVSCPRCGRSDRLDKVLATAGEYVQHLAQKAIAEEIAKATRSNSAIKFSANKPSNRTFRWIAKDVRI